MTFFLPPLTLLPSPTPFSACLLLKADISSFKFLSSPTLFNASRSAGDGAGSRAKRFADCLEKQAAWSAPVPLIDVCYVEKLV